MSSTHDKQNLLEMKQLLRGSHFFIDEDLTIRQQEERREKMFKVRVERDKGKRAWLYKGKVVIASFGPHSKTVQQVSNKEGIGNSLTSNYATRLAGADKSEDSTWSLLC